MSKPIFCIFCNELIFTWKREYKIIRDNTLKKDFFIHSACVPTPEKLATMNLSIV